MLEAIEETFIDVLKLIPFLFLTYLIMEFIENKTSRQARKTIKNSGKWGPLFGSILGIFPQCGFSVSATNLYAARVITLGTLISVYLSTSDEMLPIFISEDVPIEIITKVLLTKLLIGMIAGFLIDLVIRLKNRGNEKNDSKIEEICKNEHCHCKEDGILKSTIKHSLKITLYILIITFLLNTLMHFLGKETIEKVMINQPILGPIVAGIIGLIPNCASSVVITKMYLENMITFGTMMSGLLVGAGIGVAVLFKANKGIKENFKIVCILYAIGVFCGIVLELII